MGDEEQATADSILNWVCQVRQWTAAEFVASHRTLFLLVYEGDRKSGSVRFDTADFETSITKMTSAQWNELKLRVIPVVKSPRNPYQDRISIGRAPNCDIVIRHPSVSKLHAHLREGENGSHTLIDLGSHNGTKLGDRRLAPNTPERLRASDTLVFGVVGARALDAGGLYALLSRLMFLANMK